MLNWHSVDEIPTVGQVVVCDNNGKIKISGVQNGKQAPYEWITIPELIDELKRLEHVVDQFSQWKTDGCPKQCVFKEEVIRIMTSNKIQLEEAIAMADNTELSNSDGKKCPDFCGMKNRECECWVEQYRNEY